jgi:uncharacterized Zn-finger protein
MLFFLTLVDFLMTFFFTEHHSCKSVLSIHELHITYLLSIYLASDCEQSPEAPTSRNIHMEQSMLIFNTLEILYIHFHHALGTAGPSNPHQERCVQTDTVGIVQC